MLIPKWNITNNRTEWAVRIADEHGKKKYFATGLTSKRMAQEYEAKLRTEISERKLFPEKFLPQVKFKDFVPEYLQKHASKKRSYQTYTYLVKQLISFFGDFLLTEINRYHIETFYAKRSQEVGVCMVNRETVILKGILTKAIEWGFLKVNPVKGFKLEREKARQRFLRHWEAEKLIEACNGAGVTYLKPLVIVGLHTGLRKEELLSIKWSHIYLDRGVLEVEDGKGGYARIVPLNETAKAELTHLLNRQKGFYVFHDRYGRRIKDIKKSFRAAIERAGLSDVRFHDLRRTFGTNCVLMGIPPKMLQKWMGHKKIETTLKYYVVTPEDFEHEAIRRLDGGDTYTDTCKNEGAERDAQPLDFFGGAEGDRTPDLLTASQARSQLRHSPAFGSGR